MKKILPFVLFLLMSVTAMAGNSYEFEETYRYDGDVTHAGSGLAKVVITDNEDGTYTIAISGMTSYVDQLSHSRTFLVKKPAESQDFLLTWIS